MRIAVAGAGAIGGYIGAKLWRAGADVVLIARGAQLAAIRAGGLRIREAEGEFVATPAAVEHPADAGPADVVLLTVKAPALVGLAPRLAPLLGPDTAVVSMQNGLPWWYFEAGGGPIEGLRLDRVDPGGVIAAAIEPRRVVGSLVYVSAALVEPGVIQHEDGNRISFGEPDGVRSERARRIAEALIAAGFRCPVTTRLRHELWVKLLGNIAFNPLSAITGLTLGQMAADPDAARLVRTVMVETEAVAHALGIELPITIDQRMAGAARAGAHRTSMLQDADAGRPLELEAVIGAPIDVGARLGVPMPATHALYTCAALGAAARRARPAAGGDAAA